MHATPVAASQVEDEASPLLTCVQLSPVYRQASYPLVNFGAPSNRQSPTTTRSYVQILSSVDREITHYPPSFQLLCISSKLSDSVIDSAISRFLAKSTQSCGVYMQQFPTSTA
ncbi:unnamed protein product [Fusarium graminearum]|nr:unnamed protein product [Fusarium graminearum]